jgi:prophage tail gpP-like protein
MTTTITPSGDQSYFSQVGPGSLQKLLQSKGKLPPVTLDIAPLNTPGLANRPNAYLERFLSYQFMASVMVPVDVFSFAFAAPDDPLPINQRVKVGDIITLRANQIPICTGIIDQVEVEVDREFGEKITITGRNMLSQLEDQECVNPESQQVFGSKETIQGVFRKCVQNTRINPTLASQNGPKNAYLFATEPGESKLAAITRYLEPLNCMVWMAPNGQVKMGKPNMAGTIQSSVFVSRKDRNSNCMDMRVTRVGTQIPSIIIPVLAGSESVQSKLAPSQAVLNPAQEPTRLRTSGHTTTKAVIVSNPTSGDPSEFPIVTSLIVARQQSAQPKSILISYALRELARQNFSELQVEATVPGHYDDSGTPYTVDNCYRIFYDRGDVDEVMYLYEVQYQLDEAGGQRSVLHFCRLGTIVSQQVAR